MKHNTIRWLWNVTGKRKWYICSLIFAEILYGGSGVFYALCLRGIVDNATDRNRNGFWLYVILTVLLVLGQLLTRFFTRYMEEKSRASLENLFKERLLKSILYKDFAAVSAVHSGEWLNRLTNDSVVVSTNLVDILPGISGMTVKLVSACVMITILDPRFAMLIVPAGVVVLVMATAFRKQIKRLHKKIQEKDGILRIFMQERLGSLMMIRSFAAEEQTLLRAGDKLNDHMTARMKKNRFSNLCNFAFQSGMHGMYVLGVCYCGYGILTGVISYGTLTAITQLITQIQSPFANISNYLPKSYAMTASAERLMDIERFENDCDTSPKSLSEILAFYENDLSEIGLKDAGFTYYPATEKVGKLTKDSMPVVLHDLTLSVRKGEYAAFTGHSGCGKSTILKLLMCIYKPDSGERFVLDKNGNSLTLDSAWHRLFAYVPQGNQLMSGTIREIVTFADKSGLNDDHRIYHALQIACADEFVQGLKNGLDTMLGERGTGLSEGQMQRIAVARAIFSESPIMMLDESTSALDENTERQLLENLRSMTDKTVIIVTHRPAALDICDKIFRFSENGVVVLKSDGIHAGDAK